MGSWNDFNDAPRNTNLIPIGTLAKVRLTIRPGGFDDAAQGLTGGYATRGSTGAVYLTGEFTVTEGQYAQRKIFTLIGLYSPKGAVRPLPRSARPARRKSRSLPPNARCAAKYSRVRSPRPAKARMPPRYRASSCPRSTF